MYIRFVLFYVFFLFLFLDFDNSNEKRIGNSTPLEPLKPSGGYRFESANQQNSDKLAK